MNLVGKILTVFIFVASLVFMGFAVAVYATHQNWELCIDNAEEKATAEHPVGYKQQLANERVRTATLRTEKANLEDGLAREKLAKKEALTKVEDRLDTLKREYENKSKEYEAESQKARVAAAAVKTSNDESAALRIEVTDLREKRIEAERTRDESVERAVKLTDRIHQKVLELKRLKERQKQLADELADAVAVCRKFRLVPDPRRYPDVPPEVEGIVKGVAPGNLVEISAGSDEGLLQGHRLFVIRRGGGGSKFVGKIEVMRTDFDRAVCKIVQADAAMQPGDFVYTVLPGQNRVSMKQPAKG